MEETKKSETESKIEILDTDIKGVLEIKIKEVLKLEPNNPKICTAIRFLRRSFSKEDGLSEMDKEMKLLKSVAFVLKIKEILKQEKNQPLILDTTWLLTNIFSEKDDNVIPFLKEGILFPLKDLLNNDSLNDEVLGQVVWTIGNIAGSICKNEPAKYVFLVTGIVEILLKLAKKNKPKLAANMSWTFCNICRGRVKPIQETCDSIIATFIPYLHSTNQNLILDTAWMLSYLDDEKSIKSIIEFNGIKRLIELLTHQNLSIQIASLRTIGNVTAATSENVTFLIKSGWINKLEEILKTTVQKVSIKKEIIWSISNLAAEYEESIHESFLASKILQGVFRWYNSSSQQIEVKTECFFCFFNLLAYDKVDFFSEKYKSITKMGMEIFADILNYHDKIKPFILLDCLEIIQKILHIGKSKGNSVFSSYLELSTLNKISELSTNPQAKQKINWIKSRLEEKE